MTSSRRIFVAGHRGMVGSSICRFLAQFENVDIITRTRNQLDLLDQIQVNTFFAENNIDEVILAAAKVGGIYANENFPADFIFQNLQIQNNIIHSAHIHGVQKLLFLGSSCIYPKNAYQPMDEQTLLSGGLEPTNEPYAIAKIAGIKMCESYNRQYGRDYRCVMPTNLYGPGDNFNDTTSHVVPALIRRFHVAKIKGFADVAIWGSGKPMREFLYVDDMAEASIFIHNIEASEYQKHTTPMLSHINIGTGMDISIRDLAFLLKEVVGYNGEIKFDENFKDGSMRKLLDISRVNSLGWLAQTDLKKGLEKTYAWFKQNEANIRI